MHFPQGILEYTPFRTESYGQGGQHRPIDIAFTAELAKDAVRRDFTINALYWDTSANQLVDPLNGLADLEAKRLCTCAHDPFQTLQDDGLRLLRLARFAGQLGFSVEPGLMKAAHVHANNILAIPAARVAVEMRKICLADIPYGQQGGHMHAMRLLDATGVLSHLIPDWGACRGVAQRAKYHAYDVLQHSLYTFEACPPDLSLRLAGLLHDIAKPVMLIRHGNMHAHEVVGAEMVGDILPKLGFPLALCVEVSKLVRYHMVDLKGDMQENQLRVLFARLGFSFVEKLIALRQADLIGSGRITAQDTVQKWSALLAAMRAEGAIDDMRQLAVNGKDIMHATGLPMGKYIGDIKEELFALVAREPDKNQKEILTKAAMTIAKRDQLL